MNRSKLFVATMLATLFLEMIAIAQTASPITPPSGETQQLQWSGVDVDASQFKGVRDLFVNALRMRPVVDQPNFAVWSLLMARCLRFTALDRQIVRGVMDKAA
jgi:hypothetical protein